MCVFVGGTSSQQLSPLPAAATPNRLHPSFCVCVLLCAAAVVLCWVAMTAMGLNFLGDGLRDVLDPRLKIQQ